MGPRPSSRAPTGRRSPLCTTSSGGRALTASCSTSTRTIRDHADMENPIIRKLLFDWINFDNDDASTPFYGEVWVEEEHIEEARMMTQEIGGAEFTFYPVDAIQGRVDLNNWE